MKENQSLLRYNGINYLVPFILITSCFALWGLCQRHHQPDGESLLKIFRMSVTDGTLVQVAFYGGYFAMAFPAAMFIRRFSYKAGVLTGLGLYAVGAFLFLSRDAHRKLLSLPYRLLYPYVRTIVSRDEL